MENNKNIGFKFSYLALKLLGKNLYSNAWAALSELVANGLDASAENVYLYIDMRNKHKSTIEVFDDGNGMSFEDLRDNYVHIGRNRRLNQENADNVMGRKGIGKLSALFLSRHYYIATKKLNNDFYIYEMDFSIEKENSNEEQPQMTLVNEIDYDNNQFKKFTKGTMIRMEDVNLKGYADVSIDSLNNVLSDFFAIDDIDNRNIFLKVVTSDEEVSSEYVKVKKRTPFKNMVKIVCFDEATYVRLKDKYEGNIYKIPYKKYKEQLYENKTTVSREVLSKRFYEIPDENSKMKEGKITGWIGIHSSIKTDIAEKNDENFKKNKLYNPLKLRVYVRNKLAIDNFLPIINNTQVFVNFIEGEISYNILDDNQFPDIATTSRQNMDENDGRIINLATDVKREITKLIKARQEISKEISEKEKNLNISSNTKAKEALANTIDKTIKRVTDDIPDITIHKNDVLNYSNEIKTSVLKSVQGETIKNKYKVFFSHSRKNKSFLDFFFFILKKVGIRETEMFYTSKDNRPEIDIKKSLAEISKANIIDNNTIMFFYSTEEFLESEFCMFEGGAAWATRTQDDFFITFDDYKNIPTYLNPMDEFLLSLNNSSDIFNGVTYNGVVQSLNFLIRHINIGREINHEIIISLFGEVDFPDSVELSEGVRPKLNETIIKYWDTYIKNGCYDAALLDKYI